MFPGPLTRPWDTPKILANSARRSGGPWRIAAAYDLYWLVASQAFFGIWLRDENVPGEALEAILNGPLANAFLTERASNQHFTNQSLKQLPMPKHQKLKETLRKPFDDLRPKSRRCASVLFGAVGDKRGTEHAAHRNRC